MKILKINMPEGFEINSFNTSTGEVILKPIKEDVFSLKTWEDILKFVDKKDYDYLDLLDLLKIFNHKHHLVYQQKAIVITKVLNQGWIADQNNSYEPKYYPRFDTQCSSGFQFYDYAVWYTITNDIGSHLCFKTRELAMHAGTYFTEIYKGFMFP